jgi:hypothetical protein
MSIDYVGKGNDDGTNFGRSNGKIGFYGLTTPIVKPSFTNAAVLTTLATSTGSAGSTAIWGFTTAAQANALTALVIELRAKMVAFGLITT